MTVTLPPFPVDDNTLGLLEQALDPRAHGDPEATSSSVWPLLRMMSQLAGSDTDAVEREDAGTRLMRDPQYHDHDVLRALIAEVRQLRLDLQASQVEVGELVDEVDTLRCRLSATEADLDEAREAAREGKPRG